MTEDRNRVELDRREISRRYEYIRDQRQPASTRTNVSRDEALSQLGRSKRSSDPGLLEQTFKLGAVVAGGLAFHKFMFQERLCLWIDCDQAAEDAFIGNKHVDAAAVGL